MLWPLGPFNFDATPIGVEVEGAVEVFPGRHGWVKGGLAEEVQGEFGLREELVSE